MNDNLESRSNLISRQQMQPLSSLASGQLVGRFTLLEFLGEGGTGSVWTAEDPARKDEIRDGRIVLKFLRDDIRRCPQAVEQFRASYRKVQQLHHEHICPMMDLGEDEQFGVFQVIHFVSGMTLDELMTQQDSERIGLPLAEVVRWLTPVARALDYAHRQGIVHRDIKPGNIIVDLQSGEVHVVDFGLAAEVRTTMSRHSRSVLEISGTEPYMAPEQWQGQAQDGRSDQYSIAVVAWELLTGKLPYLGSGQTLGFAVTQSPVPQLPIDLQHLQPVFCKAMAKDRNARFLSVEEFVESLKNSGHQLQETFPGTATLSPADDLATLLTQTQEFVVRKHAQANQMVHQTRQYADAVKILENIPENLRDATLYSQALTKRDRVVKLDLAVRQAIAEVRVDQLRPEIEELLELQPERDDLRRLLLHLPKRPPKPVRPTMLAAPFSAKEAQAAQEAWAKHLGIETEVTNSLGMIFSLIPPGTFDMGSPESELEREEDEILHRVTMTQPKLMGVFPVTQEEWTAVMGSNPSYFSGKKSRLEKLFGAKDEDMSFSPVESVSWFDCDQFLDRLNESHGIEGWYYRLPTEAEWEYACRAGSVTPFWFGSQLNGHQAHCDGDYPYPDDSAEGPSVSSTFPVGSYGKNSFGLYDQLGQVWEWCHDWYGDYDAEVVEDPTGAVSGYPRVIRGGSWLSEANQCRCACRQSEDPGIRASYVGFRVICESDTDDH